MLWARQVTRWLSDLLRRSPAFNWQSYSMLQWSSNLRFRDVVEIASVPIVWSDLELKKSCISWIPLNLKSLLSQFCSLKATRYILSCSNQLLFMLMWLKSVIAFLSNTTQRAAWFYLFFHSDTVLCFLSMPNLLFPDSLLIHVRLGCWKHFKVYIAIFKWKQW